MSNPIGNELNDFFSTYISETDDDLNATKAFVGASSADQLQKVVLQLTELIGNTISLETIGIATNRWFESQEEAKAWGQTLLNTLSNSENSGSSRVSDSNGTPLNEGDSVMVIKDLKVRGGSSDLKRGTRIKNVHLTDDPEAIECKVNGSQLVLKTCFLKKI